MRKRSRRRLMLVTACVIALGLASRRPAAPEFVKAYVGDVLWGVMFFLLCALAWPRQQSVKLAAWAIATTELIEVSQLYQGAWAQRIRATRVGGLLLGHTFLWSDVVCVFLGGVLGAWVDAQVRRRPRSV